MSGQKRFIGKNVLEAARERVAYVFDSFPKVYVSFSGGKDSTCMLHLVMHEAIRRKRKVGILFIDLEGQYKLTIDHINECCKLYAAHIELFWICLPLHLRNAPTALMKSWGNHEGYRYAHDWPGAVAPQQYMPDELQGREYYHPNDRGYEHEVKPRLERIRKILHEEDDNGDGRSGQRNA